LEGEKQKIVKALNNKDLNTGDDVRAAIKQLNHKINTTTLNNADQNKIIKEITILKGNEDKAERLS